MNLGSSADYSAVVSATGFLRPRASRSIETFHDHLLTSNRILALVGAGLSAPSGIPTYRGAGGVWRTHDVTQLCTPAGFKNDPGMVWSFELERRRMIRDAQPNAAHRALARLAERKSNFLTLTMNVDELSERAEHPVHQLHHLHGSIFDAKCSICGLLLSGDDAEHAITPLLRHDFFESLRAGRYTSLPHGGLWRPSSSWDRMVYGIHTATLDEDHS
jgi:NAD-dependent deacetylase sirtuin 5